jgi:hypothetical protein
MTLRPPRLTLPSALLLTITPRTMGATKDDAAKTVL